MSEQECPRCGSLLPIDDEGLCHTCGYVFGHATVAMPALKKKAPQPGADAPQVAAAPPVGATAAAPAKSSQGKMIGLLVGIGLLLLIVIGAILGIVLSSGGDDAATPAPAETTTE